MSTRKQRLANKRNAQNSTGPKTDEGKQRSSQNALKHGIYALESVIPGEDPAGVDEERRYHNKLHPGDSEPDESLLRGRALQTRTLELQRFGRYEADLSRRQRQAYKALMECRKHENQQAAPAPPTTASNRGIPDHSSPREPFYHPAGDPTVQHNELPERTPIPPIRTESTASDPPGSKTSDENAA